MKRLSFLFNSLTLALVLGHPAALAQSGSPAASSATLVYTVKAGDTLFVDGGMTLYPRFV